MKRPDNHHSHHAYHVSQPTTVFVALAARQVGKVLADEGERVVVSHRCVKAEPLRGAAQPVTRWAVRRVLLAR
jgi:hypothetical protein